MNNFITGSDIHGDIAVGQLTFMESGTIDIRVNSSISIDPLVLDTFHMTSDFIFFALQRSDWMTEFASTYKFPDDSIFIEDSTPNLTLIKGGKED